MKKWLGRLALILLAVLACLELAHLGDKEISLISENTEVILRRTPAAAITDTERAVMEELSGLPAVQTLIESGRGDLTASENPEILEALGTDLDLESAVVSVLPYEEGSALLLSWQEKKSITMLQRTGSGDEAEYFKVYARDGLLGTRSTYENWDNERARQFLVHHDWFSWLRSDL